MDESIISALWKERRELATKLAKLDELLIAYGETLEGAAKKLMTNTQGKPASSTAITHDELVDAVVSKTKKVQTAIVAFLSANGQQHRKTILDHLIGLGLMGNEKDPMQRLAIYLSGMREAEIVTSDGAGNFKLARHHSRLSEVS